MNRVYKWCQYLDNLTNEVLTWAARHTFNGGITVPMPTAATDAATKQYVDDHVTDAAGAHAASAIANTPAGTIAATTVQAALNELDTEKAALAGASFTGAVTVQTPTASTNPATKGYVDAYPRAKAWARLLCGASGSVSILGQFNVASASYSINALTVTFSTAMADSNYAPELTPGVNIASQSRILTWDSTTTTSFKVYQYNSSGVAQAWAANNEFTFVVFGN